MNLLKRFMLLSFIIIDIIIMQVIWKYFYSKDSASDHGTLYQIRNLLHRTNIVNKPANDFNSCDDFFKLVVNCHILAAAMKVLGMGVNCHILAAAMKVLGMGSLTDTPHEAVLPNAENICMMSNNERKSLLFEVCKKVCNYISVKYDTASGTIDNVHEYGKQLLSIGCFYIEFSDAIKEGDGDRVLRCWKYLLLIFKNSGRKNYSIEALNLLCQYFYSLTPRQSLELIWSRFVNVHGLPGRNVPNDLHMEHLNCICKEAIRGLGVNKTDRAISRVAKSLGTLSPVLDQYDLVNNVPDTSSIHKAPISDKDRDMIIKELIQSDIFTEYAVSRIYTPIISQAS